MLMQSVQFGKEKQLDEIEPIIKTVRHPGKFYFYKRKNGTIFYCDQKQAKHEHQRSVQFGVSDGNTWFKQVQLAFKFQEQAMQKIEKTRAKAMKKKLTLKMYEDVRKKMAKALEAEQEQAKGHFEDPGRLDDLSTIPLSNISPLVKKAVDSWIQ